MGTVLCNYCTNSKLSSPIQKSDFNIEKINNYLANTQKTSEIKTNQKDVAILNELIGNSNNNNIINDNENKENLKESDDEGGKSSEQNIYNDIDVVEERPEEEELDYTYGKHSINNGKNNSIQKHSTDSFRRKSIQLYENELNNKIKKFGDYNENDDIENHTVDIIKEIEKKLGEFKKDENIDNNDEYIKKPMVIFKENKCIYQGYWNIISGNKEGSGICIDNNGNKYTGYWLKIYFMEKEDLYQLTVIIMKELSQTVI